jgi:lysophospholipase L1-like esterase
MPSRSLLVAVALAVLATAAPAAHAGLGPGDPPPSSGDGNSNHVHKQKPWKAKFQYRMERDAKAYAELNSRSDVQATLPKDQWYSIDCQMTNTTQNGEILWNHVANLGWVADQNMQTFTDGRLQGSPSCDVPGPSHVWFEQPWAATKEYRVVRTVPVRTRAGGAKRPGESYAKTTWTTIDCAAQTDGRGWVRIYQRPKVGEGWIPADALRFWQKGLPAGLPGCQGDPVSRHFVTLGDSYAAGIGARSFYSVPKNNVTKCRRSTLSYWAVLEPHLASGFISDLKDFRACSGAKTGNVLDEQLKRLDRDTALITISIGGNDLGFSTVLRNCLKPLFTTCKASVTSHFEPGDLRALEPKLDAVYRAIRSRAPNALVLVLGYPELVPRDHIDGCGAMDHTDAPYLHRAARKLNSTIQGTVGRRPGFRFVGLVQTFLGHPACNDDAADWINGFEANYVDASFHPNETGNRAIALRIASVAGRFFD